MNASPEKPSPTKNLDYIMSASKKMKGLNASITLKARGAMVKAMDASAACGISFIQILLPCLSGLPQAWTIKNSIEKTDFGKIDIGQKTSDHKSRFLNHLILNTKKSQMERKKFKNEKLN